MTNATIEQMELGFNGLRPHARATGRAGRIARAGWWFARMRDIVEHTMEVPGAPRPEQIWIPDATREVEV